MSFDHIIHVLYPELSLPCCPTIINNYNLNQSHLGKVHFRFIPDNYPVNLLKPKLNLRNFDLGYVSLCFGARIKTQPHVALLTACSLS